jgi:hypothetical protein
MRISSSSFFLSAAGLAEQVLADQLLQHHRGLRELHFVAVPEVLVRAARLQADVLAAEDARGQDAASESFGIRS